MTLFNIETITKDNKQARQYVYARENNLVYLVAEQATTSGGYVDE